MNPCPNGGSGEGPDGTGDGGDCFTAVSDYRFDVSLDVPSAELATCDSFCISATTIPFPQSFTIDAISGYDTDNNLIDIPLGQTFEFIDWDTDIPRKPVINETQVQAFEDALVSSLQSFNYYVEKVKVDINLDLVHKSNYFSISIEQTDFDFETVHGTLNYVIGCYFNTRFSGTSNRICPYSINAKSTKSSTQHLPCQLGPKPFEEAVLLRGGTGQTVTDMINVADAETMTYSFVFHKIETVDASSEFAAGEVLFLTDEELKVLENKYKTAKVYVVNSSTQAFDITTNTGLLEDKQFNELINYRKSPTVNIIDVKLLERGEVDSLFIDPAGIDCDFYTNPDCTPEVTEAQHRALERIYGLFLPRLDSYNFGDYPMNLHYIMLCDGSRVLIPTDFLLTMIPGNYHILDQITINSPDERLPVLYRIPDQLFNMRLTYTKNGNIERATWKTTYQSPQYYDYTYDALNRIESATYGVMNNGVPDASALLNGAYNVSNITYDAIGNILSLDREAFIDPTTGIAQIDQLTYKYGSLNFGEAAALGNTSQLSRLVAVQDDASGTPGDVGFNQGSVSQADNGLNDTYKYDGAGNMTYDPYKDITIAYNFLNLPEKMGEYDITYDASGRKWRQESSTEDLVYIGGFIFSNDEFASLQLADGRIYHDKLNNNYQSEYHHKDHLGNVRVAFADLNDNGRIDLADPASGEVTQVNNYYPFGMVHPENCAPGGVVGNDNQFRFNGIEHLDKVGIDLAPFRGYDPTVGRWLHIDPIFRFHETGYASMANNPIGFSDPLGLAPGGGSEKDPEKEKLKDRVAGAKWGATVVPVTADRTPRFNVRIHSSDQVNLEDLSQRSDIFNRQFTEHGISPMAPDTYWQRQQNGGWVAQAWYGIANPAWVTLQSFNPLDTQVQHLNGDLATRADRTNAFTSLAGEVALSYIPIGRLFSKIPIRFNFNPITRIRPRLSTGTIGALDDVVTYGFGSRLHAATGGMKQWFRLGRSYSHHLGQQTRLSLRWGASPRYADKIGSPFLRSINQRFRQWRIPLPGKRFADKGHFHIRF
ncbi:MAG: RHS repeat-associated core domain-containing protein [Bacteroidota bacterium]